MSKLAEIEALLFVAGEDGLKVHQLAEILSLPPTGVIQSLEKLAEQYEANPDSSLTLLETSKTYKLVTKPEFAEILRAYSRAPINQSLSRAALETLSIIAYKQPITRVEISVGLIPAVLWLSSWLLNWFERMAKRKSLAGQISM